LPAQPVFPVVPAFFKPASIAVFFYLDTIMIVTPMQEIASEVKLRLTSARHAGLDPASRNLTP
jgi:hypothetical protein